jgi:hypothetical protein
MNNTMNPSHYLTNLIAYVQSTRRYGYCYVHRIVRKSAFSFDGVLGEVAGRRVRLTWTGWGRSIQFGGHKYKAHARYDDGKPVPTKLLRSIAPISEGGAR